MKLRTFAIGLLWAALAALSPVAVIVLDDVRTGMATNWPQTRRLCVVNAAAGIAAYWRKHRALLKLPPDWQAAINDDPSNVVELRASAKRDGGDVA